MRAQKASRRSSLKILLTIWQKVRELGLSWDRLGPARAGFWELDSGNWPPNKFLLEKKMENLRTVLAAVLQLRYTVPPSLPESLPLLPLGDERRVRPPQVTHGLTTDD